MRGLFFKIFVIFWIAQSLIFVISTALILQHRMPGPGAVFDSLFRMLHSEAAESVRIYEQSGCSGLREHLIGGQVPVLEDGSGRDVCSGTVQTRPRQVEQFHSDITGYQGGQQYVWRIPAASRSGEIYFVLIRQSHVPEGHSWFEDLLHFAFPQLPVAITVGGATTFVLVLIFTRPVVRLRRAARELARGNLNARIDESARRKQPYEGDEFKALIHDFNHMADRLQSLVDAQRMLLRDVSHELRTPLARLNVVLALAREDGPAEIESHLDRMEREAEKLNQLVGQILTLSSMEAVDKAERFEPVSLNQLIEQMIPDAEYEARQRECSLAFNADGEYLAQGNRELLYRAIENVVRNAIRYTDSGTEVTITLAGDTHSTHPAALIAVSDRGPGIPESEIQAIFRPFYRVDRSRSSETGGFGVGLAIAERAVKLHGGELKAGNRRDGGTTFSIRLPLADQPSLRANAFPG